MTHVIKECIGRGRIMQEEELYFEDFYSGQKFNSLRSYRITTKEIISFGESYDPQPFHIDVEFSKNWAFEGLIASGLHTMCATLKLWLELGVFKACSLGSPGLGETQFPRPVRPGDTINVQERWF